MASKDLLIIFKRNAINLNRRGAKAQRRNQQLWKHYSVEEKAIKLTAKDGGATYKKDYQHKVKRKPKYRTILFNQDKSNFASLRLCDKIKVTYSSPSTLYSSAIILTAEGNVNTINRRGAKAQRRNQQLWKHYSVEEKAIKLTAKDGGATYKKDYQHKVKRKPKYRTILFNQDKSNFASLRLCGKIKVTYSSPSTLYSSAIILTAEGNVNTINRRGAKAQRRNQQLWKHYSVEEKAIKLTAKDGGATYKKDYQHKVKRKPK